MKLCQSKDHVLGDGAAMPTLATAITLAMMLYFILMVVLVFERVVKMFERLFEM